MDNNNVRNGGIGFFGMLGILFIGLKLGGVINWDWCWVLAPLWMPFVLWLIVFVVVFVAAVISEYQR